MNAGATNWFVSASDVRDLAAGCALLGSGGGGDPYCLEIVLRDLLAMRGSVKVVNPAEIPSDALVVNVSFVGAPVVLAEKLLSECEVLAALFGMQKKLGRTIDAVMSAEIGGGNGLAAFLVGSLLGLPVLDADGMGRAFPRGDQTAYTLHGRSASPTVVSNEHGDVVTVESGDNRRIEQLVRAICEVAGHKCFGVDYVMTGSEVQRCAVVGSVTLAHRLGKVLSCARTSRTDPLSGIQQAFEQYGGLCVHALFDGKVVEYRQEISGGFGFGTTVIDSRHRGRLSIDFQNEYLVAKQDGQTVATTPDIISVMDPENLRNIGSESLRYGQRVRVIAVQAPALFRTPAALEIVGPRAFGFQVDYRGIDRKNSDLG